MVRFKLLEFKEVSHCLESHNSTMVRFKLSSDAVVWVYRYKSQFHYGSIQTRRDLGKDVQRNFRHNSTMVRFKHCPENVIFIATSKSQFHYGSIQTLTIGFGDPATNAGHNSTMVRFKQKVRRIIERYSSYVTIPLWFDSNLVFASSKSLAKDLSQFHYGSIQTFS